MRCNKWTRGRLLAIALPYCRLPQMAKRNAGKAGRRYGNARRKQCTFEWYREIALPGERCGRNLECFIGRLWITFPSKTTSEAQADTQSFQGVSSCAA